MSQKIYPIEDLSGDTQKLFNVLNESSDLACVLIGTSYLDETLKSILQNYFVKCNTAKNLLSPKGAVGNFGSRCDLARCLALITKQKYKDLRVIEDIRNLFAHSHLTKSIGEQDVVSETNKLTYCDILKNTQLFSEVDTPTPEQIHISSRSRFNLTVVLLSRDLLLTGLSTKHREEV